MVTLTTSDKDQAKLINNRQNGRRRGRGGQQTRNGQPGNQDRGNRIDNRARGNAAQLLEKYKNLARDAQMQGDRVNTEYYLQFADHYFRVLSESRARFEEQRGQQEQRGGRRDDYRDDFQDGDEGEGEGQRFEQGEGQWAEGEDERPQPQQQQPRGDRRPRYEERSAEASDEGEEIAPQPRYDNERRQRRPRNTNAQSNGYNGGNGRAQDAGDEQVSDRIEIDRLPAGLSASLPESTVANDVEGEEAPRPRRRAPRRPRAEAVADDA